MIEHIRLQRFKNFRDAELSLGGLTLLVGTNASGKSNVRDAFRFLHGIGRGYSLADIIGEKRGEGGESVWHGIRGGSREIAMHGESSFALSADLRNEPWRFRHEVDVQVLNGLTSLIKNESLTVLQSDTHENGVDPFRSTRVFDVTPNLRGPNERFFGVQLDKRIFGVQLYVPGSPAGELNNLLADHPVLSQLTRFDSSQSGVSSARLARLAMEGFNSMRFLDLSPDAMRLPSLPGQVVLGDRGENLSSVLKAICESPSQRRAVIGWLQELTPLDVVDFEFAEDVTGKILVLLVEANGEKTSAYSASDGTLRFLGLIASLMGPKPARFYFIEELDNGIHPTRLPLLLELIEKHVADGQIQVVATTHSPYLLGLLNETSREHAALVYRLPGEREAHIHRILDIPEAARVLAEQDLSRLHSSGWLEDAVAFLETSEVAP